MSEFYEKYLLCDFFVRSKSYTFLESLGYCKKKNWTCCPIFFGTFCGFLGPEYDDVRFYVQSKIKLACM